MAILTIAGLTVAEVVRRRIAWILIGLTVVSVLLTTLGVERLVSLARDRGDAQELEIWFATSQILILVAFMFSFVLAMTAAFLAAPAIAADLESGVAQTMLARPIRRADLVLGRWLGLASWSSRLRRRVRHARDRRARIRHRVCAAASVLAVGYLAAQAVVLLTFALLLSTRLPSIAAGAICVVVFGLGWMAGVFAGIGRFFEAAPLVAAAEASRWLLPSDGLWRGAIYGLEPPAVMLLALGRGGPVSGVNPFFVSAAPPTEFLVWSVVWVAIVLGLAVLSLSRRDL